MMMKSLCGLTADEIAGLIEPSGFTMAHAVSVSNSIYKKRSGDISQITTIPKKLRELLLTSSYSGIYPPVDSQVSVDNTIKYLFRTSDLKAFETVYIPDKNRNTVCVSTQVGCRMGCSFCLTGAYGFHGDLSAHEIVNQILGIPDSKKVTHIVFMGMGEPMDNMENVLKACEIITASWGLALSPRNVTVSTVGITPGIKEFLSKSECNLTVSLHSPFSEERKKVISTENRYPVKSIIEMLKVFPLKKKRRLSMAYVMIENVNDTDSHLQELKKMMEGSRIRVNLLPYHTKPDDKHKSSSPERMHHFKHELIVSGVSASIRKSRGVDIAAACGLLASGLK